MSTEVQHDISLRCGCGVEVRIPVEAFGQTVRCPACAGLLRLAIQEKVFPMPEAPNLMVRCKACTHLIIGDQSIAGSEVVCPACGSSVKVPEPKRKAPPKRPPKRPKAAGSGAHPKAPRRKPRRRLPPRVSETLMKAAAGGKISLRPGQKICGNCGTIIEVGSTVCLECCTNSAVGKVFDWTEPVDDPKGAWKGPGKW